MAPVTHNELLMRSVRIRGRRAQHEERSVVLLAFSCGLVEVLTLIAELESRTIGVVVKQTVDNAFGLTRRGDGRT